jgi:hypothetical protein
MKVGRLIGMLEEFDPDADYIVLFPGLSNIYTVDEIDLDDDDGQTVLLKMAREVY